MAEKLRSTATSPATVVATDEDGQVRGGRDRRPTSPRREIVLTVAGLALTTFAGLLVLIEVGRLTVAALDGANMKLLFEQIVFGTIVICLVYGGLVYQLSRLGYMKRLHRHQPVPKNRLRELYDNTAPGLTVLVPSYKEEARVIRQSLLSAALLAYPRKKVVLLIDDAPEPRDPHSRHLLESALSLPEQVHALLDSARRPFAEASEAFEHRLATGFFRPRAEACQLAELHERAADQLEQWAEREQAADHADRLFVKTTFTAPARQYRRRAEALRTMLPWQLHRLRPTDLRREYQQLTTLFQAEVTAFQRKRYENLSHEPNKAMNLNCYLSLMGGTYRQIEGETGLRLEPTYEGGDLDVPDTEYILTLDADSVLCHEYALRLVHHMQQPEQNTVAIAQTPYTAFPDAPGTLERVAGATTDLQYIVHQGFTAYGATFWVGANALLRWRALNDIGEVDSTDGVVVKRYISDRTVIEDTESSIDLLSSGWQLYNYPERLSYSATPPDFGSLIVQRRRWADGGLIILPKFIRHLFQSARLWQRLPEAFLRVHYLSSIPMVNLSVPILLLYPFEANLRNIWLPLSALAYFALYGRDLIQAGYRWLDLPRVYAMNLMLIPVNLAGVLRSLKQAWTGERAVFTRTPKVLTSTPAPQWFTVCIAIMTGYCFLGAFVDALTQRWMHAIFAGVNGGFLAYAMWAYVGVRFWPAEDGSRYHSESAQRTGHRPIPHG